MFHDYTWGDSVPGNAYFIADTPGKYWVSEQSICGLYTDTINITGCTPGAVRIRINTDTICENHCIHFFADSTNNITSFLWTFPGASPDSFAGQYPPDICYRLPGAYHIRLNASNAYGHILIDTTLQVLPDPLPPFTDTTIFASYRSTVYLQAGYSAGRIEWYKDDSLLCIGCNPLTVQAIEWQSSYTCVLHNASCREECHYKVIATDIPADTWLPSVFSPNGDGKNDYFRLITDNPNISLVELSIYDRWGERLFHAQQNGPGWDGRYKGKEVEQGTYLWYLRYKVDGQAHIYTRKGDVTLVR
jgi:gliding motility-associated-like protein